MNILKTIESYTLNFWNHMICELRFNKAPSQKWYLKKAMKRTDVKNRKNINGNHKCKNLLIKDQWNWLNMEPYILQLKI